MMLWWYDIWYDRYKITQIWGYDMRYDVWYDMLYDVWYDVWLIRYDTWYIWYMIQYDIWLDSSHHIWGSDLKTPVLNPSNSDLVELKWLHLIKINLLLYCASFNSW